MSDLQATKIKYLKVAEYYLFARWIATPTFMRDPDTQGKFCVSHNIDPSTITRWKNDPNFWEDVRRFEDEWVRGYGADIKASIVAGAIKGNTEDKKIYMTHYQGYTTKTQSEKNETKTLETGPNLTSILMERAKKRKELAEKNNTNGGPDSHN